MLHEHTRTHTQDALKCQNPFQNMRLSRQTTIHYAVRYVLIPFVQRCIVKLELRAVCSANIVFLDCYNRCTYVGCQEITENEFVVSRNGGHARPPRPLGELQLIEDDHIVSQGMVAKTKQDALLQTCELNEKHNRLARTQQSRSVAPVMVEKVVCPCRGVCSSKRPVAVCHG